MSKTKVIFGTAGDDVIIDENQGDTIYGLGGADTISGNNGNDTISGDLPAIGFAFSSENAINSQVPVIPGVNYFDFGGGNFLIELTNADVLDGGNGNDTMYGDAVSISRAFSSGDATATSGSITLTSFFVGNFAQFMGSDTMNGGNGDDILYGGFSQVYHDLHAGNATADGAGSVATSHIEFFDGGCASTGSNTISGGNGDDLIIGTFNISGTQGNSDVWNYSTLALATNGGTAISSVEFNHEYCHFGGSVNTLDGGNGNDMIFGNRESSGAETISSGNAEAHNGSTAISTILQHLTDWQESSDVLNGGAGNDMMVGDVGTTHMLALSLQATSSLNSDAESTAINDHMTTTYGDDSMDGGSGDDIIYGDTILWSAEATAGNALTDGTGTAVSSALISNTTVTNGNDLVFGGNGNDTIFGDGKDFTLSVTQGTATEAGATSHADITDFSMIQGNDVIDGGSGNDVIIGDTPNYSLLDDALTPSIVNIGGVDYLKATDHAGNSIQWGNDVLTGGRGADTFDFATFKTVDGRLGTQGFDTITDFNKDKDVLNFGNVADRDNNNIVDIHDLQLSTTLSHIGDSTVITFDGGGSLTLQHLNIISLLDLYIHVSSDHVIAG